MQPHKLIHLRLSQVSSPWSLTTEHEGISHQALIERNPTIRNGGKFKPQVPNPCLTTVGLSAAVEQTHRHPSFSTPTPHSRV